MKCDTGEIYLITNNINNKQYVGQTTCFFPSGRKCGGKGRWVYHVYRALNGKNECRILANAIRKYGKNNFKLNILVKCDKKLLNQYECQFITKYNTISPNGYNIESGGSSCKKLHEETLKMMSSKCRFRYVSDKDMPNIVKAMKENNVEDLPMGIHYNHDHNAANEGFSAGYNGSRKLFIAKGRNLSQKLEQALSYLKLLKENNKEKIHLFDVNLAVESKKLIRQARISLLDSRAVEAMKKIGIHHLPQYIRYEKRKERFYTKIPNDKCKYFQINNPEESLKQAIEYIYQWQQRESV
jgi:group I intron endonuclease